jgi:hypothetical protein
MKKIFTLLTFSLLFIFGCRSKVKQQQDSIYSRHLQRHIPLEIITTPMPDNKEEMNLLLFNSSDMLDEVNVKATIDSLYKKKLIQPLVLVAFQGKQRDYGLEEADVPEAKQYKKFNDFVINELYPFIKKKVIRKFNSVAICGFRSTSINAFDIAYNNDEKVQSAGIFNPSFVGDSTTMQQISVMRKRPTLKVWVTQLDPGPLPVQFNEMMKTKKSIDVSDNIKGSFADFLIWAFPK